MESGRNEENTSELNAGEAEGKQADASEKKVKTETSKTASLGTENQKDSGSSSKSSAGDSDSGSKSSRSSHTHSWQAQTTAVHHPATGHEEQVLVKDAWTETIPNYEMVAIEVCNACGADITDNVYEHTKAHALKGENAAYHTEYVQRQTGTDTINHPAEYTTQWVEDSAAWDETVTTSYACSCGATK